MLLIISYEGWILPDGFVPRSLHCDITEEHHYYYQRERESFAERSRYSSGRLGLSHITVRVEFNFLLNFYQILCGENILIN